MRLILIHTEYALLPNPHTCPIGDMEYSFSVSGIQRTRPLLPEFGRVREQIMMGRYTGSRDDLAEVIRLLSSTSAGGDYTAGSYNVVTRNCNDFSQALCMLLVSQNIPDWVNRAARIGRNVLPTSYTTSADGTCHVVLCRCGAMTSCGVSPSHAHT